MSEDESVQQEEPLPGEPRPGLPFPIVAIGASSGGLEAVTNLLEALPPDPGMAFLVVQHLHPGYESQLPALLTNSTRMAVREADQGVRLEPNHVYIIPPKANMKLADGVILLTPRAPRGPNMPVDELFRSLAEVHGNRAVAVVLSGDGTDGTLGCRAVKEEGGITFAQDEKTARHTSMPRSAAAEGVIDYVLPPEKIARELVRLMRQPYTGAGAAEDADGGRGTIDQVIGVLRAGTDVDFTHYKRTTIGRRIRRRMALRGADTVEAYLGVLRDDPAEIHNLYQDLLIRVTQFFRDPEAFEALKERVFPALLTDRPAGQPVRVWVTACSTGEEVYSLAIALLEFLSGRGAAVPVKILATDLNDVALEKARAGTYVDNIELDVSPGRLRRFFVRVDGHYQICKAVRELCVFSRHNMAADPPYSHLDLVSCRNVLIYMNPGLQRRVVPILHYALNPGGFLFLGSSESVGTFGELFDVVDARHRVFCKRPAMQAPVLEFSPYVTADAAPRPAGREEGLPTV